MSHLNVAEHRPRFSASDAARFAAERYGLHAAAAPLPSDRDQNFLLTTPNGRRFVMKLASSAEERSVLEAQDAAMRRLRAENLTVPTVVAGLKGEPLSEVEDESGRRHFLRVVSFVPGVPFATTRPKSLHLVRSAGRYMGRLSAALEGFDHPGAYRDMRWNLLVAAETVRGRLNLLEPKQCSLVESALCLVPRLSPFRRSVVHNDANDYNVLVDEPEIRDRNVVGLIDFGDLVHSLTVSDIAVAAAYALLDAPDPLTVLSQLVGAYHAEFPLEEAEMAALLPLIGLRLSTSVCVSAEQQAAEPENEYLSISRAPAWRTLEVLTGIEPRLAEYVVREACGLEPCRASTAVTTWIEDHLRERVEIIDGAGTADVRLDFSVASSEWSFDELTVPALAAERIARRLGETDPPIAIGRYGEVRLVYQGDQFVEGSERRTVHIGIDLFAAPGTRVRAPFDATVHSVADNDRPYDYGPTVILRHHPPDGPSFYTLYGHLSRASVAALQSGDRIARGESFAAIGAVDENGGWAPHLHFQLISDLLGRIGDFPGVARASQRAVWSSLCPDPSRLAGLPRSAAAPVADPTDLLNRRRKGLGPSLSLAYRHPIALARGQGQYLFDVDGRRFLDAVNNVAHVGHCHPHVVEAAHRAMRVLATNTRYLYEELVTYAERLTASLPDPLSVCYFVNSGSEANDLAIRIARVHTGKEDVVVLDGAYHGNLSSLIAVSPYKFRGPGGGGNPATTHVAPMPDRLRGPHRGSDAGECYARELGEAADRAAKGIAAFLIEPIMSCGGQVVHPMGFLRRAFTQIHDRGGLCIADEVQTGFGRMGQTFWAFELQDAVPDIVTLGKPIGNGFPLGAVVTTPEIAGSFDNGMEYFNTFGGNPVSCAVGMAVLDVLEREGLQHRALETGNRFAASLQSLAERHAVVGEVRGSGLFIGVELVRDRSTLEPASDETSYVVERMRERGILTSLDGLLHNVIKIKPPLVLQPHDVDRYIETLDEILAEDFVRSRLKA